MINDLSGLSKWKIFDNLRRSLLYPSLFLFVPGRDIFSSWDVLVWTACGVEPIAADSRFLNSLLAGTIQFKSGKPTCSHSGMKAALYQSLLLFMFIRFRQAYAGCHPKHTESCTPAGICWNGCCADDGADNSWPVITVVVFSHGCCDGADCCLLLQMKALVPPQPQPQPDRCSTCGILYQQTQVVRKQSRLSDNDVAFLKRISRKT